MILNRIVIVILIALLTACGETETPVGKMPPVLKMGEVAPDFSYYSLLGEEKGTLLLSQLKGKVVYLDFWASWCKPCLKSMPLLDQLRGELGEQGFEVIAVNLDFNAVNGEAFLAEHPVDYPVVRTSNESISELYKIAGLPTAYIIDREGVIRYAHQGFKDGAIEHIREQILMLLESK